MASRYHINGEGNVGECSAAKGQCPFGGADAHFGSREQAEHAAEERLTAQYGLTATAKKEKKVDVSKLSTEERENLAMDERTPPETLADLAEDEHEDVRVLVAHNLKASPEVLSKLAEDKSDYVRKFVAWNKNTPEVVLTKLSKNRDTAVRCGVAGNPSTPPEVWNTLTKDRSHSVRKVAFASNPNTPPDVLAKLASDKDFGIRTAVAKNPSTPEKILTMLLNDTELPVVFAAIDNPNWSKKSLTRLSEHQSWEIRYGVAQNPSTPFPTVVHLSSDRNNSVAEAAQRAILPRLPWSDNDKEIALGLLDEMRGKESGKYFPSLEALQEAVEGYKEASGSETFDPDNLAVLDLVSDVYAEPVEEEED